jgi:transcription elongation factor GreA
MTRAVQLTKAGRERLETTLAEERRRLEAATRILEEISGTTDDYDDSGLEDAKQEKARLENRVDELEDQLSRAVIIEDHARTQVDLGSLITLKAGDEEMRVQLVSPVEAEVVGEDVPRISDASPLGKALLGRKTGDSFEVDLGRRKASYTVLGIE